MNNQLDYTCSICFGDEYPDDILQNNRLFTTQCNHHFHYNCLYRWCFRNNNCPTCRTKNVLPESHFFDEHNYLPINLINDPQIEQFIDDYNLRLSQIYNSYFNFIDIEEQLNIIDLSSTSLIPMSSIPQYLPPPPSPMPLPTPSNPVYTNFVLNTNSNRNIRNNQFFSRNLSNNNRSNTRVNSNFTTTSFSLINRNNRRRRSGGMNMNLFRRN